MKTKCGQVRPHFKPLLPAVEALTNDASIRAAAIVALRRMGKFP